MMRADSGHHGHGVCSARYNIIQMRPCETHILITPRLHNTGLQEEEVIFTKPQTTQPESMEIQSPRICTCIQKPTHDDVPEQTCALASSAHQ
eukprot:scaffold349_cov157-Skeletonema_dohrnii-CCMP3373.AAC.12